MIERGTEKRARKSRLKRCSADRENSEGAKSEISVIREKPSFPLRAENERPSHPFAFAAGRSLVGQSTFALAHAAGAEFGYRETDGWKETGAGRGRQSG